MQVGGQPAVSQTCTRSVADRIKGINLNDQNNHHNNVDQLIDTCPDNKCLDGTVAANLTASTLLTNGNGVDVKELKGRNKSSAASNLAKNENKAPQPPLQLNEFQINAIKIIGQYLNELGLSNTTEALCDETGCYFESPLAERLRSQIKECSWLRALDTLDRLRPQLSNSQFMETRVLLLEQRVKELLANKKQVQALELLQTEYPDDEKYQHRLEFYSVLLFKDAETVSNYYSNRSDVEVIDQVLHSLHQILPSELLLMPNRFQNLVDQAWSYQKTKCELHLNTHEDQPITSDFVLKDHHCQESTLPTKCSQTFYEHRHEVWCVRFSPCGRFLASGGCSSDVFIWQLENTKKMELSLYKRVRIPDKVIAVNSISWSSDSKLVACSITPYNVRDDNQTAGVFVFDIRLGQMITELRSPKRSYCTSSFYPGTHRMVCAGWFGGIELFDVDSSPAGPIDNIEGFRIKNLVCLKDGNTIIAADSQNRVRYYDIPNRIDETIFQEKSEIVCMTVDASQQYCMVTTREHGVKLWDLKTRTNIAEFRGTTQKQFVLHSSFGGKNGELCVAGSEDSKFVIWSPKANEPLAEVCAHFYPSDPKRPVAVNSVSWNPMYPDMIASGGDDGTVKIWLPEKIRKGLTSKSTHSSMSSVYNSVC